MFTELLQHNENQSSDNTSRIPHSPSLLTEYGLQELQGYIFKHTICVFQFFCFHSILSPAVGCALGCVYLHYEFVKWHKTFIVCLWPVKVVIGNRTMRMQELAFNVFLLHVNLCHENQPPVPMEEYGCVIVDLNCKTNFSSCWQSADSISIP